MVPPEQLRHPVRVDVELMASRASHPVKLVMELDPTPKDAPREGEAAYRLRGGS